MIIAYIIDWILYKFKFIQFNIDKYELILVKVLMIWLYFFIGPETNNPS